MKFSFLLISCLINVIIYSSSSSLPSSSSKPCPNLKDPLIINSSDVPEVNLDKKEQTSSGPNNLDQELPHKHSTRFLEALTASAAPAAPSQQVGAQSNRQSTAQLPINENASPAPAPTNQNKVNDEREKESSGKKNNSAGAALARSGQPPVVYASSFSAANSSVRPAQANKIGGHAKAGHNEEATVKTAPTSTATATTSTGTATTTVAITTAVQEPAKATAEASPQVTQGTEGTENETLKVSAAVTQRPKSLDEGGSSLLWITKFAGVAILCVMLYFLVVFRSHFKRRVYYYTRTLFKLFYRYYK